MTDTRAASPDHHTRGSGRPTVVVDTSVLLADPAALGRYPDTDLVVPLAVVTELESKRDHVELGWAARRVLRCLEELRVHHGDISVAMPFGDDGATVRIEVNHRDDAGLPAVLQNPSNDNRILAVAHNLLADAPGSVTLVTKDLPLRLRASVAGVPASDHVRSSADDTYTGLIELEVSSADIDELYAERGRGVAIPGTDAVPVNAGVVLRCGSHSALARRHSDGLLRSVDPNIEVFEVRGRSAPQRVAMDLLADDDVAIVSLGGPAGTGKSVLALAAGLEAVLERKLQQRIIVFRPLFAVGGQELGYLPGTEEEKMGPWAAAVFDALGAIAGRDVIDEVQRQNLIEVLPLTHIRGRSLHDSIVIIDEAQNLEVTVLLTALSRLGQNSRVFLTHDVSQRDNLRVGRHDGVASVVAELVGEPLFGHVTLTRSERSEVAALASRLLDAR